MMFSGKTVIITGSSSGIGAQTAVEFAKRKASIVLHGRNEENLKHVKQECVSAGISEEQVIYVFGDISKETVQDSLIDNALRQFKHIDVLINNAGLMKFTPIDDFNMVDYDSIVNTNLRSAVSLSMKAVPYLKATRGCMINVSSIASSRPLIGQVSYCVSKAGMDALTRSLAFELAPFGVRVNSVNPGPIPTNISRDMPAMKEEDQVAFVNRVPMKRVGSTADIAEAILFLASDNAAFTTGLLMPVDGGLTTNALSI